MGLEVQAHVFRWLQVGGYVKEGRRTNENRIQLSEELSVKFFDGVMIGNILREYAKAKNNESALEKLDAIKDNSTPAIRLYNWNILLESLKKLGFNLQYAQKSKILNFQNEPINKVLLHLYQHQQEEEATTNQNAKPLQVDITSVPNKQVRDAGNILQFFVISIAKNFKLSPQHALNLFLDNNKYLAHLLVKGVKGSYEPIFGFLNDIEENIEYIVVTLFCVDEQESLNFFLNGIKPALISKEPMISQNCINVLKQMHTTYKNNAMPLKLVFQFMKDEGINTIFFAIKRHPDLKQQLINLAYTFLQSQLFVFLQPIDKGPLWQNDFQKLQFFSTFLQCMDIEVIKTFASNKIFSQWIKIILKSMKKSKEINQMFTLMNIMEWLWMNLEEEFESNESGLPNAYLAFLKTTSLHNNELIFIQSIRTMFSLMEQLGNRKNTYAPFFYRILINCFSFINDVDRIEYVAINFIEAFKKIQNLPGGPIVQPLLKNLQKEISLNCISLCRNLLEENRVNEEELINIIDILTRICFHDYQYAGIALQSIFDNISVMNEEMIEEFLDNNSKNCLAHFFSIAKSINRKFSDLKSDFNRYGKQGNMGKGGLVFCQQMQKHILLGHLVSFMEKCIQESTEVKEGFESMLFHTHIRIKNELSKKEQANLLLSVMKYYYPDEDQLQSRIVEYQHEINPPKEPTPPKLKSEESLKKKKSKVKSQQITETQTPKYIDSSMLKPSTYALKDLEKVKEKMQRIKTIGQKKVHDQDLLQEKKDFFRSILNEKRMIEYGGKQFQNREYKCVYDWGTGREENPNKVHGIPYIKLLNIGTEEQTSFAEDVDAIIRKYRKIWRFLFFKYSTFGAKKQEFKTQEKINIAEIWRMFKEYNVNIMKKEESQVIARLINENMKRKNDLQNLTYLGFEEYLFQACNYGYSKIGFAHLSPGQKLLMFLDKLKQVTGEKGGNVQIFENPQEVYFQQTDVVREFNRRLKDNPEYILPEGYKKVSMVQLKYDYQVHPVVFTGISQSHKDVLQVLDQIFSSKSELGFHLIEPLTHKEEKIIVKPSLFQNINEKMKDYKEGYLQPRKIPSTAQQKERQKKFVGFKRQYHPLTNFSLGIKLGLAGVNIKNRFIADEVAYWMDDMLDAVEKQSLKVENKGKKRVDNQALKRKRASIHKLKIEQQEEEKKWKKRAQSVKNKAEVDRQKKKQDDKAKRQKRKIERKVQKQKQIAAMKRKLNQFENAKKKLQEKRKEEEDRKRAEMERKKKKKEQYKKGVQEYFQKKKQQISEKQTKLKEKKDEEMLKQKEKEQKQEEFVKKLHYDILKKEESVLEKIEETKKQFDEVWTSDEIQDVFTLFETSLEYLFEHLLKYEKSKISATNSDEISLNTLHFFTLKFKIIPFMLEKNQLSKIFKTVCKNNISNIGINFMQFQQTLFRIAVKAKDLLNGILERRKEKQMAQSQVKEEIQSQKSRISPSRLIQSPKKVSLTDDYLFNADGVTDETVKELLRFLNLPKDKQGVEERYREAIEYKNVKPTNILKKQIQDLII